MMEKLPMCRICLVEDVRVRMFKVVNTNLHELYEKLTGVPFVTEDIRPILVCFFCCTKLKQCYRFLRRCLEAEELFAQRMNEDYEAKPLINQNHSGFPSGFIKSPIEHIYIVDEYQTEIAIKEEFAVVCERLEVSVEPKMEHLSEELEPENLNNSCLDVADTPPHHSETDLEDDVPLIEFKTEVEEEQEVSKMKRRARHTKRTTVAKKPKLEDALTVEQMKKEKLDSKVIRTTQERLPKPTTSFKEPYKHTRTKTTREKYKCDVCQRSFGTKNNLIYHLRAHTGEKPYKCDICERSFGQNSDLVRHIRIHTGEKPYKCRICERSFCQSGDLTKHIRIHTGDNPYKCDVSQRSFGEKSNLEYHIRVDTGEKPYKCDVCNDTFSQKDSLTEHVCKHTGEKRRRKCAVCERSFSQRSDLMRHIRTHTGEKPYKCDVCHRGFSDNSNLLKHIRIHWCKTLQL